MKIAFDHQIFSMQRYGGISRYITNLANTIVNLKHEAKIFSPFYYNEYGFKLPSTIMEGRYLKKFPRKTTRFFMAYNRSIVRKNISRWKPDIVHETYYAQRSSNLTSCPTVVTVHDMIHELFKDSFNKKDNTTYLKKQAIDRAQHVICVSHNTKKDLIDLFDIDESKVSVVHLGIDQTIKEVNFKVNIDRPYLLYVGHRGGYKNFQGFLNAFAHSKRLKKDFSIVAFGGDNFSIAEKKLIRSFGLNEEHVKHITGDDNILAGLYQQAQAFIYPSLYEGFGIPPLEAMVNQCPVISSNISSMPEVIGDAAAFFDPTAFDQMAMVIERVAYDNVYRNELTNRGSFHVQEFTWEKSTKATVEVYQSIVC